MQPTHRLSITARLLTFLAAAFLSSFLGADAHAAPKDGAKRFRSGLELTLHPHLGGIVTSVQPDSAAAKAGWKVGDRPVSFSWTRGYGAKQASALWRLGGPYKGADTVKFRVSRDGELMTLRLQQGPGTHWPASADVHALVKGKRYHYIGIGVQLGPRTRNGAIIVRVVPGSPAAKAGLKPGEFIRSSSGSTVFDGGVMRSSGNSGPPLSTGRRLVLRVADTRGTVRQAKVTTAMIVDTATAAPCRFKALWIPATPNCDAYGGAERCRAFVSRYESVVQGIKAACPQAPNTVALLQRWTSMTNALAAGERHVSAKKALGDVLAQMAGPIADDQVETLLERAKALEVAIAGSSRPFPPHLTRPFYRDLTRLKTRQSIQSRRDALARNTVMKRLKRPADEAFSPAAVAQAWLQAKPEMVVALGDAFSAWYAPACVSRVHPATGTPVLLWQLLPPLKHRQKETELPQSRRFVAVGMDGTRYVVDIARFNGKNLLNGITPYDASKAPSLSAVPRLTPCDVDVLSNAGGLPARVGTSVTKAVKKHGRCVDKRQAAHDRKEGAIQRQRLRWHTKEARLDKLADQLDAGLARCDRALAKTLGKAQKAYTKARKAALANVQAHRRRLAAGR